MTRDNIKKLLAFPIVLLVFLVFAMALAVENADAEATLQIMGNDGVFEVFGLSSSSDETVTSLELRENKIVQKAYENDGSPAASSDGLYRWVGQQVKDIPRFAEKLAEAAYDIKATPDATLTVNERVKLAPGRYLVTGGAGDAAMIAVLTDGETITMNDKSASPVHSQWVDEDVTSKAVEHKKEDVSVGKAFLNETRVSLPANLEDYGRQRDPDTGLPVPGTKGTPNRDSTRPYDMTVRISFGNPFEVDPETLSVTLNSSGGHVSDITGALTSWRMADGNVLELVFSDFSNLPMSHPPFQQGDFISIRYKASIVPPDYSMGAAHPNVISSVVSYPVSTSGDQFGETQLDSVQLYTYAVRIKLVDPSDPSRNLPDGVFYIKDEDGLYYSHSGEWLDTPDDRCKWNSDSDGYILIEGIGDGKFRLSQIGGPEGFPILDQDISLEVSSNIYDDQPLEIYASLNGGEKVKLDGVDVGDGIVDLSVHFEQQEQPLSGSLIEMVKTGDLSGYLISLICVSIALLGVIAAQRRYRRKQR